jgi:hypothetical protein
MQQEPAGGGTPEAEVQLRERLARAEAERDAATEERDFLRARLVESEKGEAELRVLLLNSQQALQDAERRLALPGPTPAPPVPWWKRLRLWEPKEGG